MSRTVEESILILASIIGIPVICIVTSVVVVIIIAWCVELTAVFLVVSGEDFTHVRDLVGWLRICTVCLRFTLVHRCGRTFFF
jgi:hypothetical protein